MGLSKLNVHVRERPAQGGIPASNVVLYYVGFDVALFVHHYVQQLAEQHAAHRTVHQHEIGSGLGDGVLTNELSAGALCLARSTRAMSKQAQIRIKVTPQEETAFSIP